VALDWLHEARPIPGDRSDPEPYFVDSRESSEEAFRDAYAHTANVDQEVRDPVGVA
jgi:hypothetical protein